ncbi:MAG: DUF4843 domain-containing protein [Prevotella sp.]|jgi:hypothetical protein|nr:DUF4843 domain-containing protein [Prevotella sp.]MDR2005271.1 DUF4843 domain-containing protein [Prevotella sp.]
MKKIILFISVVAFTLVSCDYDTLPTYVDVDRVYFEFATFSREELGNRQIAVEDVDKIQIAFGYDNPIKSDSIININVKLLGRTASEDRPITAEIIAGESTALTTEDIEILPSVIPAGSVVGTLNIKLNNTEKIKTSTLMARVRLTPNPSFHVDYTHVNVKTSSSKSGIELNIYFDAKTEMPNLWADPGGKAIIERFFGPYSNKKLEVICLACGFTREYFIFDPAVDGTGSSVAEKRITSVMAYFMIISVNNYLENWKKSHEGEPLRDENGQEVKTAYPSWI